MVMCFLKKGDECVIDLICNEYFFQGKKKVDILKYVSAIFPYSESPKQTTSLTFISLYLFHNI